MNKSEDYSLFLSHQLKSPLAAIQSMLSAISEGFTGDVNPQAMQFIEKSLQRTDEARQLITDLLDYQSLLQNDAIARDRFELVVLLSTLITKYAPVAAQKNISLKAKIPRLKRILMTGSSRSLEH